jgi:hypothetical protein
MDDGNRKNGWIIISFALVFFFVIFYVYFHNVTFNESGSPSSDTLDDSEEMPPSEDLFINDYFKGSLNTDVELEETVKPGSRSCTINGQSVPEGTVVFDTVCHFDLPEE